MRDLRSRQPLSEPGPHPCCGPLGALEIMRMKIHGGDGMGWDGRREGKEQQPCKQIHTCAYM